MDRTVDTIQAEWRAATDERKDSKFDPELEARIESLHVEHLAAVQARRSEVEDTWARRARVH